MSPLHMEDPKTEYPVIYRREGEGGAHLHICPRLQAQQVLG